MADVSAELEPWTEGVDHAQLPHDLRSVAIRSQGEKLALAPLGTPEAEGCGLLLLARSRCLFTARGLTRQILPFLENFLFWQFSIVFCDF